jgi:hypothetical protein
MRPIRGVDWCKMVLAADRLVKHLIIQALLPGLTPGEVKDLKRRLRAAQERRRFFCGLVREEVRAKLAQQDKLPKKTAQLELPLPGGRHGVVPRRYGLTEAGED